MRLTCQLRPAASDLTEVRQLPPLSQLAPRLADPLDLTARVAGHRAFDAAETLAQLDHLRRLGATEVLTLEEALELLEGGFDDDPTAVFALGYAVELLEQV